MTSLKTYVGYSIAGGTDIGAVLIFALTAKEAQNIGWQACKNIISNNVSDFAVTWLHGFDHLYRDGDPEKIEKDIPHVIMFPTTCKGCGAWGYEIGVDGVCIHCREGANEPVL